MQKKPPKPLRGEPRETHPKGIRERVDGRDRVAALLLSGMTRLQVAAELGISQKTLYAWCQEEEIAADLAAGYAAAREDARGLLVARLMDQTQRLLEIGNRSDRNDGAAVKALELSLGLAGLVPTSKIEVSAAAPVDRMTDEELAEVIAEDLRSKGWTPPA